MKPFCQLALVVTGLMLPNIVHATAQIPDKILYEGKEHSLHINPLDQYFARGNERPEVFQEGIRSTACWRRYVATWEVREKKLFLGKIEKEYWKRQEEEKDFETEWRELPLTVLFPEVSGPVHATWYSGTLRIPQGKLLYYVHMGYASVYEKETHIRVVDGVVEEITEIDNANSPALDDPGRGWNEIANFTRTGGVDPELARSWPVIDRQRGVVKAKGAPEAERDSETDVSLRKRKPRFMEILDQWTGQKDTALILAEQYGTTVEAIMLANPGIDDGWLLKPDTKVRIPSDR